MHIINSIAIDIGLIGITWAVPSNLHPVTSKVDPLAVLGWEYGYYLRKLHAKAQNYDAVAERSTDEQSSVIHHIYFWRSSRRANNVDYAGSHMTILGGRGQLT